MLSRRQFFARMRKIGFTKSDMQVTRMGVSYENEDGVYVTVPKGHEQTFTILGDVPYSGIFVEKTGRQINWGIPVAPADIGLDNMLEVCLALCRGDIYIMKPQEEK